MSIKIRQRKNGTFEVDIIVTTPSGVKLRERRRSPVTSKSGSLRWAQERERELAMRGRTKPASKEVRTPTLREFSSEYLAHAEALNKPKTLEVKRQQLRTSLLPALGDMPLDRIDARTIARYASARLGQPTKTRSVSKTSSKKVARRTVNLELGLLGRMLRTAAKWGIVHAVPEIDRLPVHEEPRRFLDIEQAQRFLDTAKAEHPAWYLWSLVALRSGLRRGELLALTWNAVDFERRQINVVASYSEIGGLGSPKGGRSRVVPLARDVLEALRAEAGDLDALVFTNRDGGRLTASAVDCAMRRIGKLAGLGRVRAHDTRHAFASACVMRGVPLKQVSEWLGHTSITQTLRYSHFAPSFGADAIERLVPSTGLRLVDGRGQGVDCPSEAPSEKPKTRVKSRA
jgi:integrase